MFIDNFIGWDYEDFTREDVLEYFESIEGEETYNVATDPGEIQADCVPSHSLGDKVPVEVNHIPGDSPNKDKVTITDENGIREYDYCSTRGSDPFMYCRYPKEFSKFGGAECVRFTTSWRFELIVYEDAAWPSNECYRATYQTTASAAEDSAEGDADDLGSNREGLIIALGTFKIPCEPEWTNTENILELQLDTANKTVQGTGTSRCYKIDNIHTDQETRTDTVTTFIFVGDVDSPNLASGDVTITEEGQIGDYTWEEIAEVPFQWTAQYTNGKIEGIINNPGLGEELSAFGRFSLIY